MSTELNSLESDGDAERALLRRIRSEGVLAAYEASLAVCQDPKAPSPARATASATLFRVAGYFDRKERGDDVPPSEMTSQEIEKAIQLAKRRLQQKPKADLFD